VWRVKRYSYPVVGIGTLNSIIVVEAFSFIIAATSLLITSLAKLGIND